MVAYTGIETISNMAEEARDYGRTIPRGMAGVVVAVFAIYAFLPAVALSAMPVENGETQLALSKEEGGYADDPILGVVANMDLGSFQGAAEIYVGILAATILFIATNAGMIGVSRLTYSMGQYRQLPERLRALHPRFRTPYVAIVVFGLVACLTILPGQAEFLGTIYAFGAMLSFTIAHLAVIALAHQAARRRAAVPRARARCAFAGTSSRCSRCSAGSAPAIAFVVVTVLNFETLVAGIDLAGARHHDLCALPPPPGPVADRDAQDRARRSRPSSTRWSTSRSSWRSRTTTTRPRRSRPRCGSPPGAVAASTCS